MAKRLLAMMLAALMVAGMTSVELPGVYAAPAEENTGETSEQAFETNTEGVSEQVIKTNTGEPVALTSEAGNENVPVTTAVVQNSYEKVDSVSTDNDYVIVYNCNGKYYALTWNGSSFTATEGTVANDKFTPSAAVEENNILWTYRNSIIRNQFVLASDADGVIVGASRENELTNSSWSMYSFYVSNNNQLQYTSWREETRYLSYDGTEWKISTDANSNFSFYQKPVVKVDLTVNWYLDNELVAEPTTTSVVAGKETKIEKDKKITEADAIFVKYTQNGVESTTEKTSFTINEVTTINYYYRTRETYDLTVNWYVDDERVAGPDVSTAVEGKQTTVTKPDAVSDKIFVKYVQNNTEYTTETTSFTVSGNTTIDYYYRTPKTYNLTVNWYLDGKLVSGPTTTSINEGKQASVTKPSAVSGKTFSEYVLNGQRYMEETNKFTITEDTTVNFYYVDSGTKDDVLYSDDISSGSEKPEYPNQGAVKIDKKAASDDFNGTGVAKVELSTTGVPMKKGVDVVIVLDISSSMTDNSSTRLANAKKAACDFIDKVLADNADGTKSNNRVGLVTFSGWNNGTHDGTGNEIKYKLKNAYAREALKTTINGLKTNGGTDYDWAFEGAGTVLADSTGRDKFVVFLTDGAPSDYNDKHWAQNNTTALNNEANQNLLTNAETVKTNGATVYAIGFDMNYTGTNNGFTATQAQAILTKIASTGCYISADNNQTELNNAFDKIANAIRKAGTEAVVTDQIGNLFDLQTIQTLPNDKGSLTFAPTINVTLYDLYTRADVGKAVEINGETVTLTLNDVGTRKGTSTVVETVTFGTDGTTATSSLKGEANIMDSNGNITAEKFTYNAATKTFMWNVGDITEQEASLSYYVYLKGSMEGIRVDGLYDTNEYAKLNYKNYKGNDTEQTFEKPKMPWGAAVVNYEFYLVNEKGEPVNSRGDKIPFENRVKINDVKQVKFNWNNSTSVEARVEAGKFVPKGYTLHISDAAYTANAVSSGTGSYTIVGTIPEGAVQSTIMYQADAQYTSSYVAFGVLNRTTLIPDSVVLDYGKTVTIDVMENDMVMDAVLHSVGKENADIGGVSLGDGSTESISQDFRSNVILDNGTAAVAGGKVKYTPTSYLDSIDKFLYAAEVTTSSSEGTEIYYYRYQTVSVIPATTVYYEDNFGNTEDNDKTNGIVFTGTWQTEGNGAETTEQDNGTVNADGHPYGYDSSYANDTQLSAGSAKYVTVAAGKAATASFTFKGTGFDLISRTDTKSTVIAVKTVNSAGNTVANKKLDLEYKSGTVYQIPVYEARFGTYDTYTVTITVSQAEAEAGATFYLDAIRIYDPIDPASEDAAEANEQYIADKEAYAQIIELRKRLLSQYADSEGKQMGAVYVDGENTNSVATYENIGPNNEIYLKPGQSIGLAIETTGAAASVQLGARAVDQAVAFKVGTDTTSEKEFTLSTAADMFYDITDTLNFVVNSDGTTRSANLVITNTSTTENVILSLTNLKITYASSGIEATIVTDEAVVTNTFTVAKARIAAMSAEDDTEELPEETPGNESTEGTEGDTPVDEDNDSEESVDAIVNKIVQEVRDAIRKLFGRWF